MLLARSWRAVRTQGNEAPRCTTPSGASQGPRAATHHPSERAALKSAEQRRPGDGTSARTVIEHGLRRRPLRCCRSPAAPTLAHQPLRAATVAGLGDPDRDNDHHQGASRALKPIAVPVRRNRRRQMFRERAPADRSFIGNRRHQTAELVFGIPVQRGATPHRDSLPQVLFQLRSETEPSTLTYALNAPLHLTELLVNTSRHNYVGASLEDVRHKKPRHSRYAYQTALAWPPTPPQTPRQQ